uniref:Uncharacterized protein n=1 Tax=Cacopsylla melanoneura TaxID=428564 RepID=A0A8D9E9B9_9HEMI
MWPSPYRTQCYVCCLLPHFQDFLQLTCMIDKSLTNRYLSKSHNMGHDDHTSEEHVSSIGLYFLQFSMRFPPSPIPSRMIRCVLGVNFQISFLCHLYILSSLYVTYETIP